MSIILLILRKKSLFVFFPPSHLQPSIPTRHGWECLSHRSSFNLTIWGEQSP